MPEMDTYVRSFGYYITVLARELRNTGLISLVKNS
jgi:hypothetical protein